jgi:hypothetical protein
MRRRGLLVVALAGLLLVPLASAASAANVQLALVPLPKSSLGAPARSLPLARDSGAVSNAEAASNASSGVTAKRLSHLGRVTGYTLDYGAFTDGAGVHSIQTTVERYRSPADAGKALAFWRREELDNASLEKLGVHFSLKRLRPAGIPGPHWVYAGTISVKGLKPIAGVDADLQHGQYLLDISVSASSTAAAERLVPGIARRLGQRLGLALAGRLHAKPVKLLPPLKPGPPAHGPKPAALVLKTADLGSTAKVVQKQYSKPKNALDPAALSVYDITMSPAGSFVVLTQEVLVGSSKVETDYFGAIVMSGIAQGFGKVRKVTQVALTGVGDNAQGEFFRVAIGGETAYESVIVLTHGAYLDFVAATGTSAPTTADVHGLAQAAANRLDKGFGG